MPSTSSSLLLLTKRNPNGPRPVSICCSFFTSRKLTNHFGPESRKLLPRISTSKSTGLSGSMKMKKLRKVKRDWEASTHLKCKASLAWAEWVEWVVWAEWEVWAEWADSLAWEATTRKKNNRREISTILTNQRKSNKRIQHDRLLCT